ncbi:RING finger protein 170-like [Pelomyxa schiedti]|nr:RING finger protein 170-like [Pelomyxa schiedti]
MLIEGVDDAVLVVTLGLGLIGLCVSYALNRAITHDLRRVQRGAEAMARRAEANKRANSQTAAGADSNTAEAPDSGSEGGAATSAPPASANASEAPAAAPAPQRIDTRLPPESVGDLQCAICYNTLKLACETVPCGHSFCGDCMVSLWDSQRRSAQLQCPIDRIPLTAVLPSHTLRNCIARLDGQLPEVPEFQRRVDAALREYNARFSSPTTFRGWVMTGLRMARHLLFNFSTLRAVHRIYLIIGLIVALGYVIAPYDILPEGAFGLFFILGLIDDLLVILLVVLLLGHAYRATL